jgi:lipopolysaccharide export system protein LptC
MWRYLLWALGTLLAAMVVYQLIGKDAPATDNREAVNQEEPDIYAEDVLFTQMQEDGSLHYRLYADTVAQFNREQLTRLVQPDLHLLNPEQPPWDIAARHGYIRKRPGPDGTLEEVVYLREAVEMEQSHPRNGQIVLRSESLYIYPNRQFAETDQDVMIDTAVGRTQAAGLTADMQTGLLNLSSNSSQRVHTIVLPEQFKKS